MNTGYMPFPPGAKRFHLRRDLPEEMCFPEFTCSLEVQTRTCAALMKGRPLPIPELFEWDINLRSYKRGRFYWYSGMGCPGTCFYSSGVGDGQFTMPVSREGLFADILQQAEKAQGKPITSLLYPAITPGPFPKWVFGPHVILHDTEAESAAVLPRPIAFTYLKTSRIRS